MSAQRDDWFSSDNGYLEITGVDLVKLAQAAYDLSSPQGLGFLHFREGGLSQADALSQIRDVGHTALRMDYVHGRSVKLWVDRDGDRLFMRDRWHDHSPTQLAALLDRVGIKLPTEWSAA